MRRGGEKAARVNEKGRAKGPAGATAEQLPVSSESLWIGRSQLTSVKGVEVRC